MARSSSGIANKPPISPGSKPVKLRSKSAAFSSYNSRLNSSSSQSAQVTDRFTISRNALTCCGVGSTHRRGSPGSESCRRQARSPVFAQPLTADRHRPLRHRKRANTGILNPNSRMLLHIPSTAGSFFLGLRAYGTNRSTGQTWISTDGDAITSPQ